MAWDREHNPTGHEGPVSIGVEYDPVIGNFVVTESSEINNAEQYPTVLTDQVIESATELVRQVVPINHNKSQLVVKRVNDSLEGDTFPVVANGAWDYNDLNEFADVLQTESQLVPKLTDPAPQAGDISYQSKRLYPDMDLQTRTFAESWATRVSYKTDEELQKLIKVVRSVVPANTVPPAPGIGQTVTLTAVNSNEAILTVETIVESDGNPVVSSTTTPIYQYEYKTRENFEFPTYTIWEVPQYSRVLNAQQRRTIVTPKYKIRRGYSRVVTVRKKVKYFTAPPDYTTLYAGATAVFEWGRPIDQVFDGAMFSVDIRQSLCDPQIFSVNPLPGDTYHSGVVDVVDLPGSTIPASTYYGNIGNEKLVDVNIQPIARKMFRLVETYVKIE